jgi:hypothetical protein
MRHPAIGSSVFQTVPPAEGSQVNTGGAPRVPETMPPVRPLPGK